MVRDWEVVVRLWGKAIGLTFVQGGIHADIDEFEGPDGILSRRKV